jgi:hypothetical protein
MPQRVFPADRPRVRRVLTASARLGATFIPGEADEASIERLFEEFPAYGSVLLRLAVVNLRTVIVTAAVYRGFDQELAPHHLTFRHRAGVTPYTST